MDSTVEAKLEKIAAQLKDEKGLGEEQYFRQVIATKSQKEKKQFLDGVEKRQEAIDHLGYALFRFPPPPKEMLQHPNCREELKYYGTFHAGEKHPSDEELSRYKGFAKHFGILEKDDEEAPAAEWVFVADYRQPVAAPAPASNIGPLSWLSAAIIMLFWNYL